MMMELMKNADDADADALQKKEIEASKKTKNGVLYKL